jgi:hypothetical protein
MSSVFNSANLERLLRPDNDTKDAVLSLTWTCLSDLPQQQQNKLYAQFFDDFTDLQVIASSVPIEFPDDLYNVLKSEALPTIHTFKLFSTKTNGWAVYLLILYKPGGMYRVYVGSGTDSFGGADVRLGHYDHLTWSMLPVLVKAAINEGYVIVNKVLLVWTPSIPAPHLRARTRLLFLAFEATFTFVFSAMRLYPEDRYSDMAHLCPWPREELQYDGLCTHCCLSEKVVSDFLLTAEEVEEELKLKAEDRKLAHLSYHERQMATNREDYLARCAKKQREYRERNVEKLAAHQSAHRAQNVVDRRFYCTLCNTACSDQSELNVHNDCAKHKRKEAGENINKFKFKCIPCIYGTDKSSNYNDHMTKSKKHVRKCAEWEAEQAAEAAAEAAELEADAMAQLKFELDLDLDLD